ncbi:Acetyltransferase (GNAT) family protein [Paenibacillus sp. UNCCL117]|uniref:GNAT family N-acetyltransferase n=1 Tax=unclassified Paenibacillus TaxID=185978 RepID=UPI0008872A03|nr:MULTISPECIES: GNAT family N-acetyltransferase [unclassified Paenibacillus]SDD02186.1 Acetyltransferase (GNAT) family protein [Paenibacillus sp. cl123]SFW32535.1 Acetyltransferase (GNAT) family protein [Paenibacillus sp. UNCCL117]
MSSSASSSTASSSSSRKELLLLEELAANAWPAYIQQSYGDWKLRATFGVTRRANSVQAIGAMPEDGWLAEVERFYRKRGLPVYIQVSDVSPEGLDECLAEAGYELELPCFLMTAQADKLLEAVRPNDESVQFELAEQADEQWLDEFLRLEGFGKERLRGYRHIFSAIGPDKAFARVLKQGETAALGTVVAERGYAGISNIIVSSRHRRQGIAEQLLSKLAAWSQEHGARKLYLQVLRDNAPAVGLYRKLGFEVVSSHHYRFQRT